MTPKPVAVAKTRPVIAPTRQAAPEIRSPAPVRIAPAARAGAKALDGVARVAGSLIESFANMFSAPTDERAPPAPEKGQKAVSQPEPPAPQQSPQPQPAKEQLPTGRTHGEAVRTEEQQRSARRQALLQQNSRDIPAERQLDMDLDSTGPERAREQHEREW
jgi:hypothetical protein